MPKNDKKLDYFAWYAAKYAADTTHLTREADYAYRRILDYIFIHEQAACRVPDDDDLLRRIGRASVDEWPAIRHALIDRPNAPLRKRGAWLSSPKLTREIRKAQKLAGGRVKGAATVNARSAHAQRQDSDRSATAQRTVSDRSAGQSKSKKNPSDSKKEKEPVLTPELPRNGLEALDAVKAVLTKYAPKVQAGDDQIAVWLRDTIHDGWQLAAALAEEADHFSDIKNAAYMSRILQRKAEDGWRCEDAEGYVRVALKRQWPIEVQA